MDATPSVNNAAMIRLPVNMQIRFCSRFLHTDDCFRTEQQQQLQQKWFEMESD